VPPAAGCDGRSSSSSAEERHQPTESLRISGAAGGDALAMSEMGASATQHGKQLLELGFTVDQVVHG